MTPVRVIIRPSAEADIRDAHGWYETRKAGLGIEFLDAVRTTLTRISIHPEAGAVVHRSIRRVLLRRVPYGLFNLIRTEGIVVIACMHGKRDASRWTSRLD